MPRRVKSVVRKTGDAIARTARKFTAKLNPRKRAAAKATEAPTMSAKAAAKPRSNPPLARPTRRTSDVPLDLLADTYAPKQTSVRGSFRSDGTDQQNDQEIPLGVGDRFENEDHFTNKSGDVRIGTHGRTYEPGEART